MPIFYTNTGSLNILEVSSSAVVSSSRGSVLKVIGSGSSIVSITGSTGAIAEFSDFNSTDSSIFVLSSASVDIFKITKDPVVLITASLIVSGNSGAGIFSQGATLIDYTSGISRSGSYMVWRSPFPCIVTGLYGYREGGGPSRVNAARSGSTGYGLLMSADLTLSSSNAWSASVLTLQNTTFNSGDALKLIMSGSASNNQLAVQVDFRRRF